MSRDGYECRALGDLFTEVRRQVREKNIPPFSITAGKGFESHEEKWGRNIAGEQYGKYTHLIEGELAYNKGNSKSYPCGCAYMLKGHKEAAVPNVFISFKARNDNVCPDFYEQFFIAGMHEKEIRKYITSGARSDGLLNINKPDFFKLRVPYPPLPEQKKIAAILSSVDEAIAATQAVIDQTRKVKQGLLQDLLTRGIGHTRFKQTEIGEIPEAWEVRRLGEVAITQMGYAFQSTDFVDKGVGLLRMGNLYMNRLDMERNPTFLPNDYQDIYRKFLVNSGDLVMSMTGTLGKKDYGYTVMIPPGIGTLLLNQRVMKIIPKPTVNPFYLLSVLHSKIVLSVLYSVPGGTKQANLSAAHFKNILIPIPSILEQERIAKVLRAVDEDLCLYSANIESLSQVKRGLMQDLLSGSVRVTTP